MKVHVLLVALLAGCGALRPLSAACTESMVDVYDDADGDGYGDSATLESSCGVPDGKVAVDGDCDDTDPDRYPDNPEVCDGLDNDCNSAIDEGLPVGTYFTDADLDGYGDPNEQTQSCGVLDGVVTDGTDCDDADGANSPGLPEICDGQDNDCDSVIDDADDSIDPSALTDWYRDQDGDGYGGGAPRQGCTALGSYNTADGGDCDDTRPGINPSAQEGCDGLDNDCDNLVDDDDPSVDPAQLTPFYQDSDHDGLGAGAAQDLCSAPNGFSTNDDDCDDTTAAIGAEVDMATDADGDGFGDGISLGKSCPPPGPGTAALSGGVDCNDGDRKIYPGALEICGDGIDQDCAGGDAQCPPVGSFLVNSGPYWMGNPPVFSCVEACAQVFGGAASDYHCSTSGASLNYLAYVSGWGDATYCSSPVSESFSAEQAAQPGYNCGKAGCSYSAYVQDNCLNGATNWCWPK